MGVLPTGRYARPGTTTLEPYMRRTPLDPTTRPLPPYDCPTGTCAQDKICEDVSPGDPIDPNGREHVERNACNRCPSSNPAPMTRVIAQHGRNLAREEITHYEDDEGNQWQPDSWFTAPKFHGDPGIGARTPGNQTYRLIRAASDGRGWQCRYVAGVLDDTSLDLGTYDYASAPTPIRAVGNRITFGSVDDTHNDMDVTPHFSNPNYAPNMTERF